MKTHNLISSGMALIAVTVAAMGCSQIEVSPLSEDKTPPGKVENITYEAAPGKIILKYTLPEDKNLLYAKAVYTLDSGVEKEVKASYYNSQMELEGFNREDEYEIKVYAVSKSEVESEPAVIRVIPMKNLIWSISESISILPAFSGVAVKANNDTGFSAMIEIFVKDEFNNWQVLSGVATSQKKISYTARGLEVQPYDVGVVVRDRFMNRTDTTYAQITPLFELILPKDKFAPLNLPGDAILSQWTTTWGGYKMLWDDNKNTGEAYYRFITDAIDTDPQVISFDLGTPAALSRITMFNHGENIEGQPMFFYGGQIKLFEIWAANEYDADGNWSKWTKIGDFENKKPSGLPYGKNSTEDREYSQVGYDYEFEVGIPRYRYLRLKCLANWGGTTHMDIKELDIYGDNR